MQQHVDAGLDAYWGATLAEETGLARPPFSPAVVTSGRTVYVSGQTYPVIGSDAPADPATIGIGEQTRACLENLGAVVRAAGGTIEDIVKVTIFNTAMTEQGAVNEVYLAFFGDHRPARSHVEVSRLADPRLKIEIEAVAVLDG